jgi:hypothetical protein
MQRIAQQQAHSDPEGLASWLQSVPEAARTRVLVENGYWIGNFDPKLAIALLDSTPDAAAEASHLLSTVAQNYASEDPAAALAWASSIQSPEGRSAALGQTLRALAEQDPAGAAQQAVALDPKALDTVIDVGRAITARALDMKLGRRRRPSNVDAPSFQRAIEAWWPYWQMMCGRQTEPEFGDLHRASLAIAYAGVDRDQTHPKDGHEST